MAAVFPAAKVATPTAAAKLSCFNFENIFDFPFLKCWTGENLVSAKQRLSYSKGSMVKSVLRKNGAESCGFTPMSLDFDGGLKAEPIKPKTGENNMSAKASTNAFVSFNVLLLRIVNMPEQRLSATIVPTKRAAQDQVLTCRLILLPHKC